MINARAALNERAAQQFAAALPAENQHASAFDLLQLRQREQSVTIECRHGNAHARQSDGCQRFGGARPRREYAERWRPPRWIRYAVFGRVGGDEYRDVVRIELRMRTLERDAIQRRKNDDRGPDKRRRTNGGQLSCEPCRLPLGPGHDHADAAERAVCALRRVEWMDV